MTTPEPAAAAARAAATDRIRRAVDLVPEMSEDEPETETDREYERPSRDSG